MDEAHKKRLDSNDWKVLMQGGHFCSWLDIHVQKVSPTGNLMSHVHHLPNGNGFWGRVQCKSYFKSLNSWPAELCTLQMMSFPHQCLDQLQSQVNLMKRKRIESKWWTWKTWKPESDQETVDEEGQHMVEDGDISEWEDNQVNLDAESVFCDGWESMLKKISELRDQQPCYSLRQRQLGLIAAGVKRHTKERETEAYGFFWRQDNIGYLLEWFKRKMRTCWRWPLKAHTIPDLNVQGRSTLWIKRRRAEEFAPWSVQILWECAGVGKGKRSMTATRTRGNCKGWRCQTHYALYDWN